MPIPSSYILQNIRRSKWPVSANLYVNCITKLLDFFFNCDKKIREMVCLLLSFGAGKNRFALFFGDSVVFFLWFNLLEFLWIYFTEKKTPGKIWFYNPQIDQSWNTTSLSNRVKYSPNAEKQMYSTLTICSIVIYPSAILMTKSLCYHHRMTIFQNN